MCGILAIIDQKGINTSLAYKAFKRISNRGPDYSTTKVNKKMFFRQSVLSFTRTDNNEIEHSDFFDDKDYFLFNGEIYNYIEVANSINLRKPKSDTLLIKSLIRKKILFNNYENLNGMFAIFYLDGSNFMFLVDKNLQKRLFYYHRDDLLIVSSEIASITDYLNKKELNLSVLQLYFHTRHLLQGPETVYKNIYVTFPGESINGSISSDGRILLNSKHHFILKDENTIDNSMDEFNIFEKSAEIITPSCDYVSIASGGIDSTLASIFLSNSTKKPLFTFGLSFKNKDEQTKEVKITSRTKIDHIVKDVSPDEYTEALEETYSILHHPLPTHSFATQLIVSKFLKDSNIRCVIGGEGGDEIFGGYEAYKTINYDREYATSPSPYTSIGSDISDSLNELLIVKNIQMAWQKFFSINKNKFHTLSEANIQSVLEIDTYIQLTSVGLYSSDIMSQSYGIEGRNYYMDNNILNLSRSIKPFLKIDTRFNDVKTRPLMKEIFSKKLKTFPLQKQGFSGFPNESAQSLLKHKDYSFTEELLNMKIDANIINNRALEWKILNMELFAKLCL